MRRLLVLVIALAPAVAAAEPVVLSVSKTHVVVDLGAADGVGDGAVLEVLREVTVRDPVTREQLTDTFPLGTLTVTRAGEHVAEARPEEAIHARVRAGDAVRLVSDPRTLGDPWAERVERSRAPAAPAVAVARPRAGDAAARRAAAERDVADAAAVRDVWRATLGRPIDERVAAWKALLARDADNLYAAAIGDEIASLEQQAVAIDAARVAPVEDRGAALAEALDQVRGERATGAVVASPPEAAVRGRAVPLALAIRRPAEAARGWLYARRVGDGGFQRFELRADGDAYLRGEIPAALVEAPGVEWFVEVASATGAPAAAIGSDRRPEHIEVAEVREPEPAPAGRSRVSLAVDYVDFDGGLAGGFDQYTQAELDFMYRFGKPVYAFRLGFGTLAGTGGPTRVIDEDPDERCRDEAGTYRCREVAFTYGYAEVELRVKPTIAILLRPQVGRLTVSESDAAGPVDCLDGQLDAGCTVGRGYGFRARLRLGDETRTNLVLGVAGTTQVGTLLEAAYTWTAARHVPIVLAVQVTDVPVPEDFGVRLVGDVGWRKLAWFYPSLRLSYQARDVDHAGFSGGLGMNFDW